MVVRQMRVCHSLVGHFTRKKDYGRQHCKLKLVAFFFRFRNHEGQLRRVGTIRCTRGEDHLAFDHWVLHQLLPLV